MGILGCEEAFYAVDNCQDPDLDKPGIDNSPVIDLCLLAVAFLSFT